MYKAYVTQLVKALGLYLMIAGLSHRRGASFGTDFFLMSQKEAENSNTDCLKKCVMSKGIPHLRKESGKLRKEKSNSFERLKQYRERKK